MSFLFIHPRKGLFQLTKCKSCGYVFGCNNCTNENTKPKALTLFSQGSHKFFLGCNQCQTSYVFDKICPSCKGIEFNNAFGGIDELKNVLENNFDLEVFSLEDQSLKSGSKVKEKIDSKTKKQNLEINLNENLEVDSENVQIKPESKDLDNSNNEVLTENSNKYIKQSAFLTTRFFDPTINYTQFHTIVIIHSENLLIGTDYLVQEELTKNIVELFLATDSRTKIIFDTVDDNQEFFEDLKQLANNLKSFLDEEDNLESTVENDENLEFESKVLLSKKDSKKDFEQKNKSQNSNQAILNWHQKISEKESHNRRIFGFPPFYNLLLLTTQEKKKDQALHKIKIAKDLIQSQLKDLKMDKIKIGSPYSAKFLQRKGMYSYHLLIKFPRQFQDFEQFKTIITNTTFGSRIQVRLNPQHLF